MHILIIPSEEYVPKQNPLAGIFQHDQAKILIEKGHQVGALSFTINYSFSILIKALVGIKTKHSPQLSYINLLKLFIQKILIPNRSSICYDTIDKINVIRCEGFFGTMNSKLPLAKLKVLEKYFQVALKSYIKTYGKPDVIHVHNMIYAGLFVSHKKHLFKIPVIYTEHSSEYAMHEIVTEISSQLQVLYDTEQNIYAVSPELISLLENKFSVPNTIKWLPNVIDPVIERTPLSTVNSTNNKTRFLSIGNLIPLKGHIDLINAFAIAFSSVDDVELIIAGSGVLENDLLQLISKLKLTQKVKLIGQINRQEVVNQLDQCDVFVLPSHYETFGVVLIEALSRGVPVISTYCGGPECIVDDTNGKLVAPKNVHQLSDVLLNMHKNYDSYNKFELRKNVIERFGKEAFYNQIISIYNSVIQ
ncbi:MAG: glycosyltransferase [Flavobacteriales bacterium]|nr:glycosyltransferase [Flavobacteriales bacterium]